ncbi:MAG: cytochrome ubiquinol oxidase subunit I [Simkaniaceae bacterium]|nr:cytochrome ubiquinol oxidase subunit I [Simkaniaceae bacterium]
MDVVMLSRIQFALNITFHYIFPPMSIGLGLMLVIIEGFYLKTKSHTWYRLARFFTKIFALFFALGVASGFVQVFSFGNNWAEYSIFVGDVFGGVLAAEGVFAFFLEAGFIGIMLFGWDRVKPTTHYVSTILVAIGAHFSATWIVIANSWMQTPAGYKVVGTGSESRAVITNLWDVFFNPSTVDRLTHVILGCWINGAFMLMSIGGYYLLRNRFQNEGRAAFKLGAIVAFIVLILQLVEADQTARGVAVNQPEKFAALEGVYKTEPYTPINVVGWVDAENQEVHSIQIPGLLSFLTYRNFETPVRGLDQFPKENWANVPLVFQAYHLMIALWGLMMFISILTLIFWKSIMRGGSRWLLWITTFAVFAPVICNIAGWYTAELGRQPWIVWKVLRTAEGVSRSIVSSQVVGSLIMFICIYLLLGSLFFFLLNRKIQHGPTDEHDEENLYSNPQNGA